MWNFAPLGAVSLFAGSRLPRRWAWVVPVAAMAISDYFLDRDRSRPLFELTRWTIYATFAATTLLGPLANRPKLGRWLLPVLSSSGSTVFFLTSNLAMWGEGLLYPMTFSGLIVVLRRGDSVLRQHRRRRSARHGAAFRPGAHLRAAFAASWHGLDWPRSRAKSTRPIHPGPPDFLPINHVAKLLVSVRSKVEALAALAGGATIIDVKEPRNGPLGRALFDVWREVCEVVPQPIPVSVALGELNDWSAGRRRRFRRTRGLAWPSASSACRTPLPTGLTAGGVFAASSATCRFAQPAWVAVVYIDWQTARARIPNRSSRLPVRSPNARACFLTPGTSRGVPGSI